MIGAEDWNRQLRTHWSLRDEGPIVKCIKLQIKELKTLQCLPRINDFSRILSICHLEQKLCWTSVLEKRFFHNTKLQRACHRGHLFFRTIFFTYFIESRHRIKLPMDSSLKTAYDAWNVSGTFYQNSFRLIYIGSFAVFMANVIVSNDLYLNFILADLNVSKSFQVTSLLKILILFNCYFTLSINRLVFICQVTFG